MSFFTTSRTVLGMNARNLTYIQPHNMRRAKRIADDKLLSKKILKKASIPVPKLIGKIRSREELERFDWNMLPNSFALKPNRGFGGSGIVIVYGKRKNRQDAWIRADGSTVTIEDIKEYTQNILEGSYSLAGTPDIAFFEERMRLHKDLKPYTYKGIPDIRVIVFNKVPVMAMLRLPTRESGGKANLQLGAVGVGIDLASGTTTTAVRGKHASILEYLPGSRLLLSGIRIPYWKDILRLAIEAQNASNLGFLGADVAIDREHGPVFLELNARPGLQIQIANLGGLKERLERVRGLKIKTLQRGINVGMSLFGGEVEENVEEISGKRVVGTVETVKIIGKNGKEIEVKAKIDTGAYSTSIDLELAKKLGYSDTLEAFDSIDTSEYPIIRGQAAEVGKKIRLEYQNKIPDVVAINPIFSASGATFRPVVDLRFVLDKEVVVSRANIVDRADLQYSMIIGRRDLKRFLIQIH